MTFNLENDTLKSISHELIPGGRYYISKFGYVYDKSKGKIQTDYDNGWGYRIVALYSPDTKKVRMFYVHRLVGQYYLQNPEGFPEVNHKDGDKGNNDYRNLEWTTSARNTQHGISMGTINRPNRTDRNYRRLTLDEIREAVRHFCSGKSIRESAEEIGAARGTVSSIFNGRSRVREVKTAFIENSCGECECVNYLKGLRG